MKGSSAISWLPQSLAIARMAWVFTSERAEG